MLFVIGTLLTSQNKGIRMKYLKVMIKFYTVLGPKPPDKKPPDKSHPTISSRYKSQKKKKEELWAGFF